MEIPGEKRNVRAKLQSLLNVGAQLTPDTSQSAIHALENEYLQALTSFHSEVPLLRSQSQQTQVLIQRCG